MVNTITGRIRVEVQNGLTQPTAVDFHIVARDGYRLHVPGASTRFIVQ